MPLDRYESGERTVADFLEKEKNLFFPNLRRLDGDDVFLASFPRSGNDWMRTLLADVLEQMAGLETGPQLPVDISIVTPGIYTDEIGDSYKCKPEVLNGRGPGFLVVKTHHLLRAPNNRVVLLFRQPADVLISYFHFRQTFDHRWTRDGTDFFARQMIPAWTGYMRHYLDRAAARPDALLAVSYEQMHAKPVDELRRVMAFVGLGATDAQLATAVDHHAFANRRAVEDAYRRDHLPPGQRMPALARRGEVGEGKRSFSEETLALIEAETGELYRTALRLAGP